MACPVVLVDGVWKKFRLGERHTSLRDLLPALVKSTFARTPSSDLSGTGEFWAVRDLSFELHSGEALGIIGPNGAGKSTTLKLLTRILRPTRGVCRLNGRVGALIEVAAGFHPDLTGRENIFLQGAVMGMKRGEILSKLDEIIEFAGVSEFVDTQVKRYSSGMNARLGFSIAAHLNPDVLVIDEVLAVGDMAFQQKCIDRMQRFKREGVTIVFVSHNLQAVAELCDRALSLRHSVDQIGSPNEVIRRYVASLAAANPASAESVVRIAAPTLVDAARRPATAVRPGDRLRLRVECTSSENLRDFTFGFVVHRSTDNLVLYDGNFSGEELGIPSLPADVTVPVDFEFRAHLTRGSYHIVVHIFHNPTHGFSGRLAPAAIFSVDEQRTWAGIADLDVEASAGTAGSRVPLSITHGDGVVRGELV